MWIFGFGYPPYTESRTRPLDGLTRLSTIIHMWLLYPIKINIVRSAKHQDLTCGLKMVFSWLIVFLVDLVVDLLLLLALTSWLLWLVLILRSVLSPPPPLELFVVNCTILSDYEWHLCAKSSLQSNKQGECVFKILSIHSDGCTKKLWIVVL